jgi:hypothetical protein
METDINAIDPIVIITVAIDITEVENLIIEETTSMESVFMENTIMATITVADTVTKNTHGNDT